MNGTLALTRKEMVRLSRNKALPDLLDCAAGESSWGAPHGYAPAGRRGSMENEAGR